MTDEDKRRIIKLVLKENIESDKDTKEGEKKTYRSIFVGDMGNIEVRLTLKSANKELLKGAASPKLREELFIEIVENPQQTLDDLVKEPVKEEGKTGSRKKKPKKEKEEEDPEIIDAQFRISDEQKKIGPGSDESVLNAITA